MTVRQEVHTYQSRATTLANCAEAYENAKVEHDRATLKLDTCREALANAKNEMLDMIGLLDVGEK